MATRPPLGSPYVSNHLTAHLGALVPTATRPPLGSHPIPETGDGNKWSTSPGPPPVLWVVRGKEETFMARLAILSPEQVDDPTLRAMLESTGDEMFGVYGHCPDLFQAFLAFYRPATYR